MRTSRPIKYDNNIDQVILKGNLDKQTSKAILLKDIEAIIFDNMDYIEDVEQMNKLREQWFPLSQVNKIIRSNNSGQDELHVSMWICKQKGLM